MSLDSYYNLIEQDTSQYETYKYLSTQAPLIGGLLPGQRYRSSNVSGISNNISNIIKNPPGSININSIGGGKITSRQITLEVSPGFGDAYFAAGKGDFVNTDSGFILGIDESDSSTPKFYIGNDTNYLNWDGHVLSVQGDITITNSDYFNKSSDSLDDISDGTDYGRVATTSISAGKIVLTSGTGVTGSLPTANTDADITADQFSNDLSTIDGSTDKVELGLDSSGNLITQAIPADNASVASAGLYLAADYLGFYDGADWKAYIDNVGNFYFKGDNDSSIDWNISTASTLTIQGKLVTKSGSTIDGQYLGAGTVTNAKCKVNIKGWTHNLSFSAAGNNILNWTSGTITTGDGTQYAIGAGTTGIISDITYIYLDIDVSTTTLQITTTNATAIGDTKILVSVTEDSELGNDITFQVFGGDSQGSQLITGNNIVAGSITSNCLDVNNLSSISADLGTVTAAQITVGSSGYVQGGQTGFDTGTGFFLGYNGGEYKFSIGAEDGDKLTWDGDSLRIKGTLEMSEPYALPIYTVATLPAAATVVGPNPPSSNTAYNSTNTTIYASLGVDLYSSSNTVSQSSWDTLHDASASQYYSYPSASEIMAGSIQLPNFLYLHRVLFIFDTSVIPSGVTIDSGSFSIWGRTSYGYGGAKRKCALVQHTSASNSEIVVGDYDQVGSVEGATRISTLFTYEQYNAFTLNATGLSWIDKTGYTKLAVRGETDIDDYYDGNEGEYGSIRTVASVINKRPKLDITYSGGLSNPTNVYSDDANYATTSTGNGNIYISLSWDNGTTWTDWKLKTFTGSETTEEYGNGITELWGRGWNGDELDNGNFLVRVACDNSDFPNQKYGNFGFTLSAGNILTGIKVQVKAKWDGSTTSINHIKVTAYHGTATIPIEAGSVAFASDGDADGMLTVYDGNRWVSTLSGDEITAQSLVWRKIYSGILTNQTSDITISGLNGNTDNAYRITIEGKAAASGDYHITVRPNNDTTAGNYVHSRNYWYYVSGATNTVDQPTIAGYLLASSVYSSDSGLIGELLISAVDRNLSRTGKTDFTAAVLPDKAVGVRCASIWTDVTNEVTSLVINFSSITFTGSIIIYKLG